VFSGYFESNNLQEASIVYDGNNAFLTTVQDNEPFTYIFNVDIEQAKVSSKITASIEQSLNVAGERHLPSGWLDKNNIMIKVEGLDTSGIGKTFDMQPSWKLSEHLNEAKTVEPVMVTSKELHELKDKILGTR